MDPKDRLPPRSDSRLDHFCMPEEAGGFHDAVGAAVGMGKDIVCAGLVLYGASLGCVSAAELVSRLRTDREIICNVGEQCDAMWNTAIAWISRNSNNGFQTKTNLVITTFCNVSDADPCFEITKQPITEGRVRIDVRAYCQKPKPYRCEPDEALMKAQLFEEILRARPGEPLSQQP